jgi:TPR repeat protein
MAGPGRGIGNMGAIRRPPPLRHFLQLYRSHVAFQAMIDFVVLGGLTIAFLEPQLLLHPWSHKAGTAAPQQQQAAPVATTPIAPAPPSVAPVARPPMPAPQARQDTPPAAPPAVAAVAASDSSKSIANLKKLPPWPQVPVTAVTTPGLHDIAIPFSNLALAAPHPASRLLALDDRAFANLPYQLRDRLKLALQARADQDPDRMRDALKDVESPDGTPELLTGLSYLINAAAETNGAAETAYRAALLKGQPQAPVLLGLLLTSGAKGVTGTPAEGKSLIESASANDRAAWLAIGNGYLSGESGALDPVKGAPWIRKAAEAGEPLALLQFARLAEAGIGMDKDVAIAEGALRRAADLGLTDAEDTLGRWILAAYEKKTITDPTEGVRLQKRVIAKNLVFGMNTLGRLYNGYGQPPQWKDDARGARLYQDCARYKIRQCQNNIGFALHYGRGVDRDPVAAWARYDVGRQLAGDYVMPGLALLDKTLTPTEKDDAKKQSKDIMAQLKPPPSIIALRRDR